VKVYVARSQGKVRVSVYNSDCLIEALIPVEIAERLMRLLAEKLGEEEGEER